MVFVILCVSVGLVFHREPPADEAMRFVGPCEGAVRMDAESEIRCFDPIQDISEYDAPVDPIAALIMGVPMDINTVSADSLRLVRGIGFHLSNRIVDHRRSEGAFESLEALEQVKGIGPKLRKRLTLYVRVKP
jgi:competence ComEA-like helix-hairpin-helix protein